VTITTGLVDAYSTPTLLSLVRSEQLDIGLFVTHRFAFDDFLNAYDTFSRAGETAAVSPWIRPGTISPTGDREVEGCL
jgi:alcohol dehydrogenase